MIGLVLAAVLTQAMPDGGTFDPAWRETRDAGVVVCMTEATAIQVARGYVSMETTQAAEEKALLQSDPMTLKVILWTIAGVLAGGATAGAAICGTGHCK